MDVRAAIDEVINERPPMHFIDGAPQTWGLDSDLLRWLADTVQPHSTTIETGCGLSSLVFALTSGSHTIVAPEQHTHDMVFAWLAERGFPTEHVTSVVASSQDALPRLDPRPLDVALIDGAHAMPYPFIDWYYLANHLRPGGLVVVDDMHIGACRLLRDFLTSESGRWRPVRDDHRAAVFEKIGTEMLPAGGWPEQPFCQSPPITIWTAGAHSFGGRLRRRLRNLVAPR